MKRINREQKRIEEKRREELLNSSFTINRSSDHVLNLENDQNELRHHNRLARSNDGIKIIFLNDVKMVFYRVFYLFRGRPNDFSRRKRPRKLEKPVKHSKRSEKKNAKCDQYTGFVYIKMGQI